MGEQLPSFNEEGGITDGNQTIVGRSLYGKSERSELNHANLHIGTLAKASEK